jgi:hypothetical protein
MILRETIDLVTGWLDCVHIDTASKRVAEAQENYRRSPVEILHGIPGTNCRIALHESSHAVIGHLFGDKIVRAEVRADGSGAVDSKPASPLGHLIGTLAGPFSELILGADSQRRFSLAHSSDVLDAAMQVGQMSDMSNRAAATLAGCAVSENWPLILRVACALEANGELDGVSIAVLCGRTQ